MPIDNRISSARYDGEPDTKGDFTDEFAAVAYDAIARKLDNSFDIKVYDNGLMFEKYNMSLSCTIQRIGEKGGRYSAETLYMINHQIFDEPLCEYSFGIGSDSEEAIINGANSFADTVLRSVFSAFDSSGDSCLVSEFAGKTRVFTLSDEAPVQVIGEKYDEFPDLYSLVDAEIPNYLGSKKAYWLKLFVVAFDNMIHAEVRINGAVMYGLSEKLRDYAKNWKSIKTFHQEKQFLLMLDKNENNDRDYPSPELVISLTQKGIELLSEIRDEESSRHVLEKLKQLCGKWDRLAYEIRALAPELYTCKLFHLKQSDDIRLRFGNTPIMLKRSQLRNFGYIEQGVVQYLTEYEPDEEASLSLVNLSTAIEVMSNAIENGVALENIGLIELVVDVPDNYELL